MSQPIYKLALLFVLSAVSILPIYAKEEQSSLQELSQTYSNKASNLFMQQNIDGAIECLNEAIKINPNDPMLFLNRGFINHLSKNYQSAMEDYNHALQINPSFAFAYNNRGVLKVALHDVQGAMNDYATALSINKNYSDVYYNRGNLKYMTDDLKGALSDYDKAIELNPKDSEAYNNRGVVKKRLNFNVGALSDYSQAIAINPKDSIAYANRGRLKKLYFDNEGAAIDLNQAVALAENQVFIKNVKPLLSQNHYIAAIPSVPSFAYDFTDDTSDKIAIAPANTVNMLSPKNKPVQSIVDSVEKKPAKKVKTIESDINVSNHKKGTSGHSPVFSAGVGKVATPNIPDIRTTAVTNNATTNVKLAESYYIRVLQKCILRDLQGAIADLDKAIANNSKYADAYYYRAAIKKELGDKEGFRKDYANAIQINPSLQQYQDSDALSLISG